MANASTSGASPAHDDDASARASSVRTRPLAPRSLPDHPPERIGRYTVRRRLGMGGMGVVYEALDERLGRAVALKLMLRDDAETDRGRLRREAQALARLSHPNVVEVFEIGEHREPGSDEPPRAYVAMALVEGQPLDRWLRQRPRSTAEIVEVFVQASAGLAAAHAQGLVHRDFKPGNVLVGHDGRVRVVDFGLVRESDVVEPSTRSAERSAEALPQASLGESLTRTGAAVGTLPYMSPEQLMRLPVGPRSDQFAFCVALYEALLRRHPFVVDGEWSKLPLRVLDGEVAVPPPSRRVPARLLRAILRGLAVRPEQRWPSMDALSSELRQALAHRTPRLPVVAGAGVAAVGLWLLIPAAATDPPDRCEDAAAVMQEAWGPEAREQLRGAWMGTERPSDADTWSRIDVRMQAYAEDWWGLHRTACTGPPRSPTAAVCLLRAAEQARARLQVMGAPSDGLRDNAVRMIGELAALERCRAALDDEAPASPAASDDASGGHELERVDAWMDAGDLAQARTLLEALLDRAGRESNAGLAAEVRLRIARVELHSGNVEHAARTLEQVYLEAKHLERDRLAASAALALLELFGTRNHGFDDAARWARHARTEVERIDEPRLTARLHHAWGLALYVAGELEQALAEHQRALALREALPDAQDEEIAASLHAISLVLGMLGRFDEARPHAQRALELREAALGPRHPQVATSLMALGGIAFVKKQRAEALALHERALSIKQEHAPDDPVASFHVLLNISSIHRVDGHPQLAADALRSYLDVVDRAPNPEVVDASRMAWIRGEIAMLERRYEEALVQYERAAASDEVQHYEETRGLLGVAMALHHLGRLEESVAVHRRVVGLLEPRSGTAGDIIDINDQVFTLQSLAHVLAAMGDDEAALRELQRARALAVALPDPVDAAMIDAELGAVLVELGRVEEALLTLRPAVAALEATATAEPDLVVAGLVALGEAELATGERVAALDHAERAVRRVEAHEGEPLPRAARAWSLLARCLGTTPGERARALSLARRAQEQWTSEGLRSRRDLERVQAWLATQQRTAKPPTTPSSRP